MVDVKSETATEKPLPTNEKSSAEKENLKQKPESINIGKKIENLKEVKEKLISEIDQAENTAPTSVIGPVAGIIAPTSKQQKQVENILVEGMSEIYLSLTPQKRREFKKAGEETAKKISQLLTKAKINIGEIIKLIKKWLMLIPGVNKYFLEQEAKIKADEIIKLK